jgi:hypothetical protein
MVAYTGAKGGKVQNFSSDPTNPYVGQVWYNSTSSALKVRSSNASGAWTTGGNLNTARQQLGGAGFQTAALAFGGSAPANTGATESYNGTSWTSSPNSMNTARQLPAGCGATNTAALAFGGYTTVYVTNNESWNGTSWTELNDLNVAKETTGAGTSTAALGFGGASPSPTALTNTEIWNGTSWTEVNDLNTGRYNLAAAGAANYTVLAFGGVLSPGAASVATESWNRSEEHTSELQSQYA